MKNVSKEIIPIVFAVNDSFAAYCYVAIFSLWKHTSPCYQYEVFIASTDLSNANQEKLEGLSRDGFHVSIIDATEYIKKSDLREIHHLSVETYFRLFIPLFLPQYSKVLYLDSDICIMADVAELYCTDLEGMAVGAVPEVPRKNIVVHCNEIGISNSKNAFNAGVLLIDTVMFERLEVRKKCLAELEKDYGHKERKMIYADQDALNIVMQNNVKLLDGRWNYNTCFARRPHVIFEEYRNDYLNTQNHVGIAHFCGQDKLWMYPEEELAQEFWKYAKDTPYFYDILSASLGRSKGLVFEKYCFPYDAIEHNSRIVIYGAGKVGKVFHQHLEMTHYAEEVMWVDKEWKNVDAALGVVSPERIETIDFDYILLAAEWQEVAEEMREELIGMGISREKIVWKRYLKMKT